MHTPSTRNERSDESARRAKPRERWDEGWFRLLADAMRQLVWTADPDGRVDYYNKRIREFAGVRFENGQWVWRPMVHPDDERATNEAWAEALRTGTLYEIGHRVQRADGSYRWHLSRGTPVFDADGRVLKWYGTATDIHDQKETEEALRNVQKRYEIVNRATNDVMWEWDMDTDAISWNDALCTVFGHGSAAIEGDADWWKEHIHPDDREATLGSIYATLRGRDEAWSHSYRFQRGDGSYAAVLDRGYVARRPDGSAAWMIGSMLDLSERLRLEEELRQTARELAEADRVKDEFIAMLGHELRNPLGAISNAAELLRRRVADKPSCKRPLEILKRQVEHMTRQVDDLLDVSRVTLGKLDLRREMTDLVCVMDRAVEGIRPTCYAFRHALSVSRPAEALPVDGDAARLEQVFSNLLSNAVKYTDPGGCIEIVARREDGKAVVEVRDSGMGIRPEVAADIFDMFAQEDRTLDRSKGGLGIGLTLVKYLVEMHGGTVGVHSDGPGRGSAFTVRLPIAEADVRCEEPGDHDAEPDPRALCILLVEDNSDAADAMAGILETWGHTVRIASNGPEALEAVGDGAPDVILLDIGLPGMDGFEVARRLREGKAARASVLIALSGYGQAEDHRRAEEAGFDHYLVKPADIAALSEILAHHTSRG